MKLSLLLVVVSLLGFTKTVGAAPRIESSTETFKTSQGNVQLQTLLNGFDVIWGFDFLPNGDVLLTERPGRMWIYRAKTRQIEPVSGVPAVRAKGQGGLLDVRVHPDFAKNAFIFFTYVEGRENGEMTTVLGRAELRGQELKDVRRLRAAEAWGDDDIHFGSRIEFDGTANLWWTVGDRNQRPRVQDLAYHNGKVLRVDLEGRPASGNPFLKTKGALPEIFSVGHRSPQGLARDPATGSLWLAEMGPRGGDEINLIEAGANYGWPEATYGREYYGPKIGETHKSGTRQPVKYWVPSISPSGLMVYTGDLFGAWKGDLIIGNLSGQHLRRLKIKDEKIVDEEIWLKDKNWRFRSVHAGPGGEIFFATDEGRFARITPIP